MTDIVERLRAEHNEPMRPVSKGRLLIEAADEIERLRRALEEIADPSRALLTETKAYIAREALQDQQVGKE